MRRQITLAIALVSAGAAPNAWAASDLERLSRKGYAVLEETRVEAEFKGCEFNKRINLANGLIFVCSSYSYSYGYMPDVLILKNVRNGDIKVMIDDTEYEGTLYRR